MNWIKVSSILCVFGFFKEFRPSEPFITDYLTGPWKNFTSLQVNRDIYPVGTYSNLATLVLVLLLTDFLRYKPVIILCGLSGTITYVVLILTRTILGMQIVEFLYGLFFATEVAYYAYIYAKVEKKHYQEVSSHTKAAILLGKFLAGVTAQLTVSFDLLDYHRLNFITLSALTFATIWALFLPSVSGSIYFHKHNIGQDKDRISMLSVNIGEQFRTPDLSTPGSRDVKDLEHDNPLNKDQFLTVKKQHAYFILWQDFSSAYTNIHVVKWLLWWALATCGYLQVISYIQLLWQDTVADGADIYNGAVEAAYTIIGAVTVFGVGKLQLNWSLLGEATLSITSFLEGILLLIASQTNCIWLSYILYVTFGVIYHTIITVANFQVAKNLSEESYGLIFGINTLLALLLQSLLTFVVASGNIFTPVPTIRSQYTIYGSYFIVLGAIFTVMAIYTISKICKNGKNLQV